MHKTTHSRQKFSFSVWFGIAILAFLFFPAFQTLLKEKSTQKNLSRSFYSTVEKLKIKNRSATSLLADSFDTIQEKPRFDYSRMALEAIGTPDFILFVRKADSLIYWSSNSLLVDMASVSNSGRDEMVHEDGTWYLYHTIVKGNYAFTGLTILLRSHKIRNEYLADHWNRSFSLSPGGWLFQSFDGKRDSAYRHLLGSQSSEKLPERRRPEILQRGETFMLISIFFAGTGAVLLMLLFLVFNTGWFRKNRNAGIVVFILVIVFLRSIQYHFRFPGMLYATGLFSPALYSSPFIAASLGDLLVNVSLVLAMAAVFFRYGIIPERRPPFHQVQICARNILLISVLLFSHLVSGYIIGTMVLNASVPINFQRVSEMVPESVYSIVIILMIIAANWFLAVKIIPAIQNHIKRSYLLADLFLSLLFPAILLILSAELSFLIFPFSIAVFIIFLTIFIRNRITSYFTFPVVLLFLFFYSLFAATILNQQNHTRDKLKTDLLALRLSKTRNPVTEFMYEQVSEKIKTDSTINSRIRHSRNANDLQDAIKGYISDTCFGPPWAKYNLQITLCDTVSQLKIQPEGYLESCLHYFNKIQHDFGDSTGIKGLIYIDLGAGKEYYLGIIPLSANAQQGELHYMLYIEISLNNIQPGTGYPGLLISTNTIEHIPVQGISYAFYSKNQLQHAVGTFPYPFIQSSVDTLLTKRINILRSGISHVVYPTPEGVLIITTNNASVLTKVAPFSYLFLLLSVITLISASTVNLKTQNRLLPGGFRYRFYITISVIVILAIILAGSFQIRNIIRMNDQKEQEMLREKIQSVRVELQHKLASKNSLSDISENDLDDLLLKFSNVFFTDINIFDPAGLLRSSSRPEIFEQHLVSELMNRDALNAMEEHKASFFIHTEQIGIMKFNSTYLPVFNYKNQLLGYVNLPYFIHKDTSSREITSTLVAYINIYILLIVAGVVLSLLISNYFTAPLTLLSEKLANIRVGRVNEKISWKRDDEIGQLVNQYNSMVDELAESAEQLARSERESAWKEMARQVAHEIKNPLTPMKLSVQYLHKAWEEKAPDIEQRLKSFTATMVEQIDHLSEIATGFSDFARLSRVQKEIVAPGEILRSLLNLYNDTPGIRFTVTDNTSGATVFAGKSHISRVFTNLLNNAVQAIGGKHDGQVNINLDVEGRKMIIRISDNGHGISAGQKDKIFQPDFTTKTSGMGLGLAIVKAIMDEHSGEITFTSENETGTTFNLILPLYEG